MAATDRVADVFELPGTPTECNTSRAGNTSPETDVPTMPQNENQAEYRAFGKRPAHR